MWERPPGLTFGQRSAIAMVLGMVVLVAALSGMLSLM